MNKMHTVTCNICGKNNTEQLTVQNGYHIVRCIHCGLVYVNPRPDWTMLKTIYDTYHGRSGKDESSWETLMSRNFAAVSSLLIKMFPSGGKLLDIGCGYGHFIEIMRARGWHTEGIDPSAPTVAFAQSKGLGVMQSTIDEAPLRDGAYTAITMFYVLEHLTDPISALKRVYRALAPGGAAVIRVPDTTPLVRFLSLLGIRNNLYDPPFHLYDFSPASLRRILEKAGFESVTVEPGEPTLPPSPAERVISMFTGYAAKLLYRLSGKVFLLPGVSKTAVALKLPGNRSGA